MELALIIIVYLIATAGVLIVMGLAARRTRRKAWQAYYDAPRGTRSRPSGRRR